MKMKMKMKLIDYYKFVVPCTLVPSSMQQRMLSPPK